MPRSDATHHPHWHDAADDPRAAYEHHPVEDMEPLPERDCAGCGEHHLRLLLWLSQPYAGRKTPRKVYQRTAVYVWLLAPHLLPWRTVSEMARAIKLSRDQTHTLLAALKNTSNPTPAP